MTIRATPSLDAMAEEFQFLSEAEDFYRRLDWYRTHMNPTALPFLEDYPPCGFLEEYTRLKSHYEALQAVLYSADGDVYNPPKWVSTPEAARLWRRAHEFMGFDDSE